MPKRVVKAIVAEQVNFNDLPKGTYRLRLNGEISVWQVLLATVTIICTLGTIYMKIAENTEVNAQQWTRIVVAENDTKKNAADILAVKTQMVQDNNALKSELLQQMSGIREDMAAMRAEVKAALLEYQHSRTNH